MTSAFSAPKGIGGKYVPPPDKSITHRALMLGAISSGKTRISNPLETGDCLSTRRCLEALGCVFEGSGPQVIVNGVGLRGFREPDRALDAENSGTSMRLLSGLLAGLPFFTVLSGDSSLRGRPMGRVVEPLRAMRGRIEGRQGGKYAPLCFLPGNGWLSPLSWDLPVPSAQVKSCLLLAALRAEGVSRIGGRTSSRDHTERMLGALGISISMQDSDILLIPPTELPGFEIDVPGDISSAAFFLAAALISGSSLAVDGCGVNPTRCGFIEVLRRMGAEVEMRQERVSLGEPIGSLRLSPGALQATRVEPPEVPDLIDEIPLIAVLGMFAEGTTEVRGASELRFKESDRLAMIAQMAGELGGRVDLFDDGFSVKGPQKLSTGSVDPKGDHRIAMAAAVAGAGIPGGVRVRGFDCARVSYPDFARDFASLGGEVLG